MYDIVLCVYERFRVDGLKRYVNDDRFRVDGDKNMRLLAFAFTIFFVWTGSKSGGFTSLVQYIFFHIIKRLTSIRSKHPGNEILMPVLFPLWRNISKFTVFY